MIGLHNEEARTPLYAMASLKFLVLPWWIPRDNPAKRRHIEKRSLGKFIPVSSYIRKNKKNGSPPAPLRYLFLRKSVCFFENERYFEVTSMGSETRMHNSSVFLRSSQIFYRVQCFASLSKHSTKSISQNTCL